MPYHFSNMPGWCWMGPPPPNSILPLTSQLFTNTEGQYLGYVMRSGAHINLMALTDGELLDVEAYRYYQGMMRAQHIANQVSVESSLEAHVRLRQTAISRGWRPGESFPAAPPTGFRSAGGADFIYQEVRNAPVREIMRPAGGRFLAGRALLRFGFNAAACYGYFLFWEWVVANNEGIISIRERANANRVRALALYSAAIATDAAGRDELGARFDLMLQGVISHMGARMWPGFNFDSAVPIDLGCTYGSISIRGGNGDDLYPEPQWFRVDQPDAIVRHRGTGVIPTSNYSITWEVASGPTPTLDVLVCPALAESSELVSRVASQSMATPGSVVVNVPSGYDLFIRVLGGTLNVDPEQPINAVYDLTVSHVGAGETCADATVMAEGTSLSIDHRATLQPSEPSLELWFKVTAAGNYKFTFVITESSENGNSIPGDAHITTYTGNCAALVQNIAPAALGPVGTVCFSGNANGDVWLKVSVGTDSATALLSYTVTYAAGTCS